MLHSPQCSLSATSVNQRSPCTLSPLYQSIPPANTAYNDGITEKVAFHSTRCSRPQLLIPLRPTRASYVQGIGYAIRCSRPTPGNPRHTIPSYVIPAGQPTSRGLGPHGRVTARATDRRPGTESLRPYHPESPLGTQVPTPSRSLPAYTVNVPSSRGLTRTNAESATSIHSSRGSGGGGTDDTKNVPSGRMRRKIERRVFGYAAISSSPLTPRTSSKKPASPGSGHSRTIPPAVSNSIARNVSNTGCSTGHRRTNARASSPQPMSSSFRSAAVAATGALGRTKNVNGRPAARRYRSSAAAASTESRGS